MGLPVETMLKNVGSVSFSPKSERCQEALIVLHSPQLHASITHGGCRLAALIVRMQVFIRWLFCTFEPYVESVGQDDS
jgi:hypothetical protein